MADSDMEAIKSRCNYVVPWLEIQNRCIYRLRLIVQLYDLDVPFYHVRMMIILLLSNLRNRKVGSQLDPNLKVLVRPQILHLRQVSCVSQRFLTLNVPIQVKEEDADFDLDVADQDYIEQYRQN